MRRHTKTTSPLAELFHHRWAAPVLAELSREGGGAKFATLAHRTGAGRDSLKRTLKALGEAGLIGPNPGYGHPMRPEYLLTPAGKRVAPLCEGLVGTLRRLGIEAVALRKWSMPVVHAVGVHGGRFSRVLAGLPGITPRALALALKQLQSAGLLERRIGEDYPPGVTYRLTRRAGRLCPALDGLSRAW